MPTILERQGKTLESFFCWQFVDEKYISDNDFKNIIKKFDFLSEEQRESITYKYHLNISHKNSDVYNCVYDLNILRLFYFERKNTSSLLKSSIYKLNYFHLENTMEDYNIEKFFKQNKNKYYNHQSVWANEKELTKDYYVNNCYFEVCEIQESFLNLIKSRYRENILGGL